MLVQPKITGKARTVIIDNIIAPECTKNGYAIAFGEFLELPRHSISPLRAARDDEFWCELFRKPVCLFVVDQPTVAFDTVVMGVEPAS